MLGVGGLSFSRGMGVSMLILGLTERAGSRYDSLNFPFTLVPLGGKKEKKKSVLKPIYLIFYRGLRLSEYSLASSNHFSGCVFDADLGKWDSLLFHL